MIMVKPKELAAELNKLLGAGTVKMGDDESLEVVTIPTGVAPVDYLLGGGIPKGRFTELFGAYSTLKSYIGLKAIAECQKEGGLAVLIDTEHAFDPEWAESLGVETKDLIYQSPQSGEEAVDLAEVLIRNGADLIVWDSIAASLPQAEGQKRLANESVQPARLAALMSIGLRKLTTANSNTAVVCINQTRLNVGQMFGDPEVVPGGRALPFYASHRIALRKAGKVKDGKKAHDSEGKQANVNIVTAHKIRATLEKSKLTAPSRDVLFSFDLESGTVDEIGFLITQGVLDGIVKQEGRKWWIENQTDPVVGRAKFRESLEANPAMVETLKQEVFNLAFHGKQQEADKGTED
jgi:recombination protein RecA